MPRHPGLHVVQQRPAIGVQLQPGQGGQGDQLVGRQLIGGQHMEAGAAGSRCAAGTVGVGAALAVMAVPQREQLALQRHQVGRRLGVDHHQVAGDAAPGPQPQRLRQRAQQAQAMRRASGHQHDRPVARDAEAPQQPAVAAVGGRGRAAVLRPRQAEHQRGGQALHGGEVVGADAQVAQPDAGQRGRHQRGPRHMAGLAVLVDHRAQRGGVVRGGGGKGQLGLAVGRDAQAHAERANRIQPGGQRHAPAGQQHGVGWRQGVQRGLRLAGGAVAAQPARAVGLHRDRHHLRVALGQKVRRLQRRLGHQARLALEQQRLLRGQPLGAHEQAGKRRVRLIGTRVGQRHVEGRDQLDLQRALAQVVQHHLAELDVVLRADPHRGVGLHAGPQRIEAHPVGVEAALVLRGGVGCRVLGDRHRLRLPVPAQVEKAAVGIAQGVVAGSGDVAGRVAAIATAPAAPARAVGTQRHAVATVRQQVRGLQRGGAGQHLAQEARRAPTLHGALYQWHWLIEHRHLAGRLFMQQRGHRLDLRVAHAPALGHAAQQQVGQCHDRHALVVGHQRGHRRDHVGAGLAGHGEVKRLDEAAAAAGAQRGQRVEVAAGAVRRNLRRQRGGVGRDHQLVGRCAAQRQPRHTLRRVLVGQRLVTPGVGRFGDAPGQFQRPGEVDLLAQRGVAGIGQHAAGRLGQHQRGHQVLKHRARPRAQPGQRAHRIERPAQRRPMPHRHIALGDGVQAGQA